MYRVEIGYNTFIECEDAEDAAREVVENMDSEYFDDMLNECYGEVYICGYHYNAAYALEQIDPIAYRCAMNDFYDSVQSDIVYDLERMDDGDNETFYGINVEYIEDEEDEEDEEEDEEDEE